MRSRSIWLAMLLGSGCSQFYGLDVPTKVDARADVDVTDSDGDGIYDSADNCQLANPDQADRHRNRIGDRREGCIMLPLRGNDNDDNDSINDTNDLCIGVPPPQDDSDKDGVADACDDHASQDARFCVWTFREPAAGEAADVWKQSWTYSSAWSLAGSSLLVGSAMGTLYAESANMFTAPNGIAVDAYLRIEGYTPPFAAGI